MIEGQSMPDLRERISLVNCEVVVGQVFRLLDWDQLHYGHRELHIVELILVYLRIDKAVLIHELSQALSCRLDPTDLSRSSRPFFVFEYRVVDLLEEEGLALAKEHPIGCVPEQCGVGRVR